MMLFEGAIILGVISGFLNLIPFWGAILGALVPIIGAGLLQNQSLTTLAVILVTVVGLHTLPGEFSGSENYWGAGKHHSGGRDSWNFVLGLAVGVIGVLLAVRLTVLVKIVADLHPSLSKTCQSSGGASSSSPAVVAFERHACECSSGAVGGKEPRLAGRRPRTRKYVAKLKDTPL